MSHRWKPGAVVAVVLFLGLVSVARAVVVTETYTPADGESPASYTFSIRVQGNEHLRDIHIIAEKGEKLKIGATSGVTVTPTSGGGSGSSRSGWNSPSMGSGGTTSDLSWYTEDEQSGEEGDTDTTDDPVEAGNTAHVTVECGPKSKTGNVYCVPTFDGSDDAPPPSGPTFPGPIACVTPHPGNRTPTASSSVPLGFETTEDGTEWQVYLAATQSDPLDPGTDPLGIGINVNDAPLPAYGISVTPNFGTFAPSPPEEFSTGEAQVNVGAAPVGTEFYVVVVGKRDGEIELFTDPIKYTVSLP